MKKTAVVCVVLAGLLAGAALLSLCVGSANLSLGQLFAAFGDESLPAHTIFLQIRLPRVLLAMLVGAALSGAGALVQGVFKNPMADPHILGVSSGAALGAAIGMVFFESSALLPPIAFLGGLGAVSLVWFLSRKGGTVSLLLAGTALAVGRLAGILDFASPRVEDETARQYIEHNLATTQSGRIRLTVREGYYDGEVARTILEIAPVRMEDSIVLHDWWHYPNGEEFFDRGVLTFLL